jgi:hypothetical protein
MSEQIGFAMVLIVAVASVAALLFMSGVNPTANVIAPQPQTGIAIDACMSVQCAGHAPAEALLDAYGHIVYKDNGNPVCVCPLAP